MCILKRTFPVSDTLLLFSQRCKYFGVIKILILIFNGLLLHRT